jgi:hypothetical protein
MLSMAVVPEPMEHIMIKSSNQKSNDTKASITVCSSPLCGVFLEYSAPAKATSTVYYWDYHNLVKSLTQLLMYLSKETEERFSSKEVVSHQTFIRSFNRFLKIRVYTNCSLQFVSDLGLTIAAILSDVQNYSTVGS